MRRVLAVTVLLLVTGCSAETPPPAPASPGAPVAPPVAPPPVVPPSPAAPPVTSTPAVEAPVVVLDPGHNGGNAANPAAINRKVPAGRGRTKPCNTTGTTTNDGYAEHAFTFDVAQRAGKLLADKGIRVVFTRDDDTSVGPCVDKRAEIGNSAQAAAVVSIHADGNNSPGANGFHIAYSAPPLNDAQGGPAAKLTRSLRDSLRENGFRYSDYLGEEGLSAREDLAGLNLSERPAALVECGNMRNATEAARMSTADGRQQYAAGIAGGILSYLGA
ncbi:N-acetylmuramoyl-L-alanine amidase [Amycolatopsis magusensis]|uniref:N-acetylmuramoyl-L-alanine amidase n=1 Tax=Amycolatopsis magusensis TaxID=882444 RepID=UPI003C2C289C